ncbi:MAG TPA: MATE family efflux transporter [Candidatus Angelobacter sp.]|nr:MATE family efflux transporter [Candidatus Angelobacter sp.]
MPGTEDAATGGRRPGVPDGSLREVLRLAVPALGALVAQPLFVLVDAAIVGTLGTLPLAGLGAAATLVSLVLGLCIFLAYATTSSVARRVGEGRWDAAVAEGVEGMALGLALGAALAVATWLLARPAVVALGASAEVTPYAVTYLHVVALGFPAALVAMAGVGVLRGLQDTRTTLVVTVVAVSVNAALAALLVLHLHVGIAGSAVATAAAEVVQASAYVVVLVRVARRHGVGLRPSGAGMLAAARTSGPLFARTVALRSVFLVAAAVAARLGDADLAAYHVSFQVWMLLALAADALAIAGMALLGRYLGAGDARGARRVTGRLVRLGAAMGGVLGLLVLACVPWLPSLFGHDPVVRGLVAASLVVVAVQQPLAAPVFVLDGVLIGAGDGRWLAGAGLLVLVAFVPAAYAVLARDLGVVGLWWALTWFMVVRGTLLAWRARGDSWLRTSSAPVPELHLEPTSSRPRSGRFEV